MSANTYEQLGEYLDKRAQERVKPVLEEIDRKTRFLEAELSKILNHIIYQDEHYREVALKKAVDEHNSAVLKLYYSIDSSDIARLAIPIPKVSI